MEIGLELSWYQAQYSDDCLSRRDTSVEVDPKNCFHCVRHRFLAHRRLSCVYHVHVLTQADFFARVVSRSSADVSSKMSVTRAANVPNPQNMDMS